MGSEPIQVTCYEGYKANESPRSFVWADRTLRINKIVDRWYGSSTDSRCGITDYFKVQADDGNTYIICYSRLFGGWAVLVP